MRVNWLAIVIADVVYFLFGYLWYDVLFKAMWIAETSKVNPQYTMVTGWYPFAVALVMGFFSAYGIARALAWRGDINPTRGAIIGASLGALIFGTMTWMGYAYSGFGMALGWINIGFVVVGLGIQGLILGIMKPKSA